MSRVVILCGVLAGLGALALTGAAPAPKPEEKPATLEALLREKVEEFPELEADPQTKLGHVLNKLSQRFSRPNDKPPFYVPIEINVQAFEAENVKEPQEIAIVAEKPLARAVNISPATYLRRVLQRVTEKGPVPSGATFILRKDHIEITTVGAVRTEIWGQDYQGPYLSLVSAGIEKKPLEEALKQLAELADHNIVLDVRVGDRAKTPVTGRFNNVPLDTAVTFLADMADLQPILQDNVIYVTTRDNAMRLEAKQRKDMADQPDAEGPPKPRVGPGFRGYLRDPKGAGAGMQ